MAVTVWKGHLTFGLVSIPVRLFRAARREKISFRQLYRREPVQQLAAEPTSEPEEARADTAETEAYEPAQVQPIRQGAYTREDRQPIEPSQIVKGYEFEKDQYVTVTKEEIAEIAPKTATEMEILEFVKLEEIDPVYFDTSYYVVPEEAGEKPYALLFDALKQSGHVALAELAMRRRQHAVVIRPGETGLLAHTMYYADEIRKSDEYRADTTAIAKKERELALMLISSMTEKFQPEKFKDAYREKLQELIAAKVAGREMVMKTSPEVAPVVDIMEALQRSLQIRKKPVTSEAAPARKTKKKAQR
jgi:DNA end-binding protein Ku